ncbi:MAG TPA: hypothetical protein DEH78_12785 [Solibacterales bacterium]|nr:hypothetical protein [Bryobacterales bacterium]
MQLSLSHDSPSSETCFERFHKDATLQRLRALDIKAQRHGLHSLDPTKNRLIGLGMELDGENRVTKNSYGVFHLAWRAQESGDWAERLTSEAAELRAAIRQAHGTTLKYVVWAGMGGSAEDKSMYNALGLLKKGPRVYVLDSTDPAKLKAILEDIAQRSDGSLGEALRSTLVVGMALGMTSYEPVVNLQKLAVLYDRNKIDGRANFIYMTLPGSLLDQFGAARGFRKIELQLDNGNATSGRHSSPLTRGSLVPLALAGADLRRWVQGTLLNEQNVNDAWRLAAFLHAQGVAGRDKVTLLLPKWMAGAGLWTKQDFEESLGKSEAIGIKIVIDERPKLANYFPPREQRQDRVFLAVQEKGAANDDAIKVRRAGYPIATLTLPKDSPLSRYMQFIHYAVFGIGYLRGMNFVTQPGVELYKSITNKLFEEAQQVGGVEKTEQWQRWRGSQRQIKWQGGVTLNLSAIPGAAWSSASAAEVYGMLLRSYADTREMEYGELTFFGDMRYAARGRAVRKSLDRAAEGLFRSSLRMPVDVYEGPAMNHSYHEMVIGHGKCLSTVLLSEKAEKLPAADYTADYHRAQFLATQMALEQRGRPVVSLTLRDLEAPTLAALDSFFKEAAKTAKRRGV